MDSHSAHNHTKAALNMLDQRWYTYDPKRRQLREHADRLSALRYAETVISGEPKQMVQILVLDGIVSMPSVR